MPALGRMGCGGFGRMGAVGIASYNAMALYDPLASLGSDLLAWWDADPRYWGTSGNIVNGPTRVSSWLDIVGGFSLSNSDVTEGSRPLHSLTSFNGEPGVTFDGIDDTLVAAQVFSLPTGASPCDVWVLCQQDATSGTRVPFFYGGSGQPTSRHLKRALGSTPSRAQATIGDGGASALSVTGTLVDFFGRHVVRAQFGGTTTELTVSGTDEGSVAIVPGTATTVTRMGAQNSGAINFWQGQIAAVLVTNPLSADTAAGLQSWLNLRRRL